MCNLFLFLYQIVSGVVRYIQFMATFLTTANKKITDNYG